MQRWLVRKGCDNFAKPWAGSLRLEESVREFIAHCSEWTGKEPSLDKAGDYFNEKGQATIRNWMLDKVTNLDMPADTRLNAGSRTQVPESALAEARGGTRMSVHSVESK